MNCASLYDDLKLRAYLSRIGLRLKKSSGQHFMIDLPLIEEIAECLGGKRKVVEIGAGLGSLTCQLAKNHDIVWAVEKDARFKEGFEENLAPFEGVQFVREDFLEFNPLRFDLSPDGSSEFAGNIPYNITVPIIEKLIEDRSFYSKGVLTVQKEIADRITASPGGKEISPLTYLVKSFFSASQIREIPPDSFFPPPAVYSSVLQIEPLDEPRISVDPDFFFSLIRGIYNYRRKTIRKSLSIIEKVDLNKSEIKKVLRDSGIDPMRRPERISLEEFDVLCKSILLLKSEKGNSEGSFSWK